ncbi:thioesterase family protein [Streptomyces griseofuscus]|uniref:thioesterase family protein n=1 Tax=Streptomyces TaxID=1883 RepID=UPI0011884054|nr:MULTISPECIES: hotdog domain-containing protein [Streptomyces]MBA9043764.1 putative thioesterase [Streptomyces murinus]MBJ6998971.1 thioesterase [Streptomyces sp. CRPSP2-6A1]BBC98158.1 thioesterase [Streptomyces rochei]
MRDEVSDAPQVSDVHRVTDADTARALGSGEVPVLGTPRLIAWLEAATVRAAAPFTGPGETTVGTAVRVRHLRATHVGGRVEVTARPPARTGARRLTFAVRAVDAAGLPVAEGEIDRAVVDRRRFLEGEP